MVIFTGFSSKKTDLTKQTGEKLFPLGTGSITPGRTVANWGLLFSVTMLAMTLPPKAGRVWIKFPSGSIARAVQSAVSPVRNSTESLGASARPSRVPPINTTDGLVSRMQPAAREAYQPDKKWSSVSYRKIRLTGYP